MKNEIIEKKLGIPPDYQYKALFHGNFIQSNWHSNKLTAIAHVAELTKKISVLDLGCGSGNFELFFAKKLKSITALDYHLEALDFIKKKISEKKIKNVKLVHGDITRLAAIKTLEKYDLIILIDVIEHIEMKEAEKLVRSLKKILNKDGKICIITPNYKSFWVHLEHILDRFTIVPHFEGDQHLAKYYPDNLSSLFSKNGFTTEKIRTFNLISFAVPNRFMSNIFCRIELASGMKFGNLLLGIFSNEE